MQPVVSVAPSEKSCSVVRFPFHVPDEFRSGVASVGNFDGIHSGHQYLFRALLARAGSNPRIAVSFYPHPIQVLRGIPQLQNITGIREKTIALAASQVDLLYLVHFTKSTAEMSAARFIESVLVEGLGIRELVVGQDASIGRDREGDVAFLKRVLPHYGISLEVVPQFEYDGVRPSSRLVRELVQNGEMRQAARLLGRDFEIICRVGRGDGRGRQIGFPTANLVVGNRLIPQNGVYACLVWYKQKRYRAVANVGVRPTFEGNDRRVEVHILDVPEELRNFESLYGYRIHVSFIGRLRDEKKFGTVDELVFQIKADIVQARGILS